MHVEFLPFLPAVPQLLSLTSLRTWGPKYTLSAARWVREKGGSRGVNNEKERIIFHLGTHGDKLPNMWTILWNSSTQKVDKFFLRDTSCCEIISTYISLLASGFQYPKDELSTEDKITLRIVESYLDFKVGNHYWLHKIFTAFEELPAWWFWRC